MPQAGGTAVISEVTIPHADEDGTTWGVAEFARIRACSAIPRTLASSATSQRQPRVVYDSSRQGRLWATCMERGEVWRRYEQLQTIHLGARQPEPEEAIDSMKPYHVLELPGKGKPN